MVFNKEKSPDPLSSNSEEFQGKWIILSDEHVIESDEDAETLIKKTREKYPQKTFLLAKVPLQRMFLL
jgi:recombination DNA repair RAD52 pathway protein